MFVAVDANVVLSALLTKGKSFDVFAINKLIRRSEFIAPEYLFFEIFNCPIWSSEKAFKYQSRIQIFSTTELLELLGFFR